MKLEEAYKILKENVRYSHSSCEGFVYLSQIKELLNKEESHVDKLATNIAEVACYQRLAENILNK